MNINCKIHHNMSYTSDSEYRTFYNNFRIAILEALNNGISWEDIIKNLKFENLAVITFTIKAFGNLIYYDLVKIKERSIDEQDILYVRVLVTGWYGINELKHLFNPRYIELCKSSISEMNIVPLDVICKIIDKI